MYGSGCAECSASHRPARDRPTSAPSGLRFPPPGREFRLGYGLLFPFELGFVLPHCQHQHREFPSGCNGRLGKAASSSKSDCPAFQRRELLHPTDQGRRRLEQQAPHGSIAASRDAPGPIHFSGLMPDRRSLLALLQMNAFCATVKFEAFIGFCFSSSHERTTENSNFKRSRFVRNDRVRPPNAVISFSLPSDLDRGTGPVAACCSARPGCHSAAGTDWRCAKERGS